MPDIKDMANEYVTETINAQRSIDLTGVTKTVELLLEARESGRTVYVIGNGGSAATASHAATDFLKTSSKIHGKHTRAIAIPDSVPVLTAISNDSNYESSFTEQVNWFGKPGDVLLAISASGNSPNIISAVRAAKSNNMSVIGLTGFGGGKLSELADISVVVDSSDYGPVEDAHMMIIHLITRMLRNIEMPVTG